MMCEVGGDFAPLPIGFASLCAPGLSTGSMGVLSDADIPGPDDDRKSSVNPINSANFQKKEFQELWSRINRKAAYTVHFRNPRTGEEVRCRDR